VKHTVKSPSKKAAFVDPADVAPGIQWKEFVDLAGKHVFKLIRNEHFRCTITSLLQGAQKAAKKLTPPDGCRFKTVTSEDPTDGNVFYLAFHPVAAEGVKTAKKKASKKASKKTAKKAAEETPSDDNLNANGSAGE